MKNYINKIIVGVLGFAMLVTTQGVFAASTVTWNTASNDCKGLSIINATTLEGYQNPCWPSSSVSADKGETINVRIYYHNTGTATATNTRVMLIPTSSLGTSSNTKTFTGRIVSDQGSVSFSSSVRANISSSQTLTLSSVKWYTNNTSETLTPLLNGQTGKEVLTDNGLAIGSVTAGWPSQGSVVVAFKISSNTAPEVCKDTSATNYGGPLPCTYPPQVCKDPTATNYGGALPCVYPQPTYCTISNFQANPTSITKGNSSTLSWSTNNCNSVVITPNLGTYGPSGSKTVYPTATTTYTLKAYASNGTLGDTENITVNVNTPSVMTGNLSASQSSCTISVGNSTCTIPFSWTTNNPEATSSVTRNGSTVASGNNGNQNFSISKGSQTYYLYNNSKLLDTESVSASCASGTNWNGSICEAVVVNTCTINNFTANPTSITSGESSVLNWSTSNCVNVVISNLGYNVPNSGSQAVYPTNTKTYTLTAYGQNGVSETRSATVYVNQQALCAINSFYASPTSIEEGDASVLNWSTSDCTSVSISQGVGSVNNSGSRAVYPTVTKTYTLTAYGANNVTQSRSVTIYVDENNNDDDQCYINSFTASDTSIDEGDSTTLKWNTTNCDRVKISDIGNVDDSGSKKVYPREDTTYTLTAYDDDGSTRTKTVRIYVDEDNNNDECSINSFTANRININSGDAITLKWRTTDCDDVYISGVGDVNNNGDKVVYPTSSRTYTLRAIDDDDNEDSKSIYIYVNYNPIVPPVYNTNVVTTVATNISQTGAQLNGLITSTNATNANVYFEYGRTVTLGLRTSARTTSGNSNFSDYVTGLSANTIYYFQAVSESGNGISRGAIEVFRTLAYTPVTPVTPVKPIVIQGPTVVASASPIVLRIENRYQTIGIGETVDYTVYYKNISNSTLTNPMVQVFIPKGITLINASRGTYSESDRTLSAPIEDLLPGGEGVIYLQGVVNSLDANLAQIVTTAILVYTNPNGAQENAMAYVLNNPKIVNLLGASAFFGGFLGMSLVGWLFLILLILLIILIARSFYNNRQSDTIIHNHPN